MNAVDINHLTYRYGRVTALRDVELHVPEGALYALLGPNGSGKTTLLQLLMGLRRPPAGCVSVLGADASALTPRVRTQIGYVAEGQTLPRWMTVGEIESFLAPLYDSWDAVLARELRERFELDPTRKVYTLSRGEQVKAALAFALAPRPRLLVMDEPFTGMDALVKDDLVRGLLASAGTEGWTVILCSHDIGELELLADWVGFLDHGSMRISETMERVRARFKHVEVTMAAEQFLTSRDVRALPSDWLSVEQAGQRMTFLTSQLTDAPIEQVAASRLGGVAHVEARDATLREIFVALARHNTTAKGEIAA